MFNKSVPGALSSSLLYFLNCYDSLAVTVNKLVGWNLLFLFRLQKADVQRDITGDVHPLEVYISTWQLQVVDFSQVPFSE